MTQLSKPILDRVKMFIKAIASFLILFGISQKYDNALSAENLVFKTRPYDLQPAITPKSITVSKYQPRYETQYVPKQVTRYRAVIKERVELQTVKVPVHTPQTAYRQEIYEVWSPRGIHEPQAKQQAINPPKWSQNHSLTGKARYQVRKVPVQVNQISYREEKRYITVQRHEMEAYQDVIYVPQSLSLHAVEERERLVPRTVLQKIWPQYVDPFSPAILAGHSLFLPPIRQPDLTP